MKDIWKIVVATSGRGTTFGRNKNEVMSVDSLNAAFAKGEREVQVLAKVERVV